MAVAEITRPKTFLKEAVHVASGHILLEGELEIPVNAEGIVVLPDGSGSGRHGPRNRTVAEELLEKKLGTLLINLLTPLEKTLDAATSEMRFDIGLLAGRLADVTDWLGKDARTRDLPIGYFAASTASAAALVAAAARPLVVRAIVSRGGRPELAGSTLRQVEAPTLLIVGEKDRQVLELNQEAFARLHAEKSLRVVPGATQLFPEGSSLKEVARRGSEWLLSHLALVPSFA